MSSLPGDGKFLSLAVIYADPRENLLSTWLILLRVDSVHGVAGPS